jgi:MFS family permease
MFLVIAAVNFPFMGPIMAGIPVVAEQVLTEAPVALGLLMSGFAGGNLVGYVLAGTLPDSSSKSLRRIVIALLAGFSIVLGIMGASASTWVDFGLLSGLGVGNGYVTIVLSSTIQKNAPRNMLGRIMSLLMFSSIGLIPVSAAISGALVAGTFPFCCPAPL